MGYIIEITDSGATTAEIEAGRDAALRYLETLGIPAPIAWAAQLAAADGQPHDETAAAAWEAAECEAFRVMFADWAEWPEHAVMSCVVWDD